MLLNDGDDLFLCKIWIHREDQSCHTRDMRRCRRGALECQVGCRDVHSRRYNVEFWTAVTPPSVASPFCFTHTLTVRANCPDGENLRVGSSRIVNGTVVITSCKH